MGLEKAFPAFSAVMKVSQMGDRGRVGWVMCGIDLRGTFAHNVTFFRDGIEIDLEV